MRKKSSAKSNKKNRFDDERETRTSSKTNDVSWYAQNEALLRDAASIPFSQSVGTRFSLNLTSDPTATQGISQPTLVVPGLMSLDIAPVLSGIDSAAAPVNIASTALYSFVRHANSGHSNYEAPDLMMYCIAMGNIYSYINWLMRIYGEANLYSHANRYLPRALVQADHAQFDDVINNLANFRYGINALIHKAASLACPANMTYFQRLAFLFSGIYSEGESIKSQLYMYTPYGFYQYAETTSETGGELAFHSLWSFANIADQITPLTVAQLLDIGTQLLDPILSSEDMNIMSGDILKAFGSEGVLKLAPLGEQYLIVPVTDLTVLEQFQNANILGVQYSGSTNVFAAGIKQTQVASTATSYLTTLARLTFTDSVAAHTGADLMQTRFTEIFGSHVLNTILTQPGPGDVIERTRMQFTGQVLTQDKQLHLQPICATEIAVRCSMYIATPAGSYQEYRLNQVSMIPSSGTSTASFLLLLQQHCQAENFKFHPMLYYYMDTTPTADTSNFVFMFTALDFDNYAVISATNLDRMNEAAMLSLFNVPSVARAY